MTCQQVKFECYYNTGTMDLITKKGGNCLINLSYTFLHTTLTENEVIQGRGLRFPCNDRIDEVNKFSIMAFSLLTEPAIIKTNNWSAVILMSCTLEPQSAEYGRCKRKFF